MPAEKFGPNYPFLDRKELLSFEEIARFTKIAVQQGVGKVRLTGGEPLLRRGIDDLVALLSSIEGLDEIALTTNGVLLSHYAERLALAGLTRVTVSLDAIDPELFSKMNGVGAKIDRVLSGINTAQIVGLPVKVNCVVQKGVNESQILPLTHWAQKNNITLRFIEYMDVGESNNWSTEEVFPAADILKEIQSEIPVTPIPRKEGDVAERFQFQEGNGEIGIISSITKTFCHDCTRLRLSAQGKIYGCLFASKGKDVRQILRTAETDHSLKDALVDFWKKRDDRYSELRGQIQQSKIEMSYIGG